MAKKTTTESDPVLVVEAPSAEVEASAAEAPAAEVAVPEAKAETPKTDGTLIVHINGLYDNLNRRTYSCGTYDASDTFLAALADSGEWAGGAIAVTRE